MCLQAPIDHCFMPLLGRYYELCYRYCFAANGTVVSNVNSYAPIS